MSKLYLQVSDLGYYMIIMPHWRNIEVPIALYHGGCDFCFRLRLGGTLCRSLEWMCPEGKYIIPYSSGLLKQTYVSELFSFLFYFLFSPSTETMAAVEICGLRFVEEGSQINIWKLVPMFCYAL